MSDIPDIHDLAKSDFSEEYVRKLLNRNPELANKKDSFGRTPLHIAAAQDQIEMAKLLIGFGADLDARDEHGRTPSIDAASTGFTEVIQLLIDRGANLEIKDYQQERTALLWAVYHYQAKPVKILLESGANPTETDKFGQNIFHLLADSLSGAKDTNPESIEKISEFIFEKVDMSVIISLLNQKTKPGFNQPSFTAIERLKRQGFTFVRGHIQNRPKGPVQIRPHFRRLPKKK